MLSDQTFLDAVKEMRELQKAFFDGAKRLIGAAKESEKKVDIMVEAMELPPTLLADDTGTMPFEDGCPVEDRIERQFQWMRPMPMTFKEPDYQNLRARVTKVVLEYLEEQKVKDDEFPSQ